MVKSRHSGKLCLLKLDLLHQKHLHGNTEENRGKRSPHMDYWEAPWQQWEGKLRGLVESISEKRAGSGMA